MVPSTPVTPPSKFTGKRKRTAALATNFQQAEDDCQQALKKFKPGPTTPVVACPLPLKWGTGTEQQDYADIEAIKNITPSVRTKAQTKTLKLKSEALGEKAADHKLQEQLSTAGVPFDPQGLTTFSASGVFNKVYLYPPPGSNPLPTYVPDFAVVLEAKGGESQCGDRYSSIYKKRVTQGSEDYVKTVGVLMAKSNYKKKSKKPKDIEERKKRQVAGLAITKLAKQSNGHLIYTGVRAGYGDKGAFDPETIFTTTT